MSALRVVKDTPVVVIEAGPGWEVVADFPDEPQHNHFDIWDAPAVLEDCPRCELDNARAEG